MFISDIAKTYVWLKKTLVTCLFVNYVQFQISFTFGTKLSGFYYKAEDSQSPDLNST